MSTPTVVVVKTKATGRIGGEGRAWSPICWHCVIISHAILVPNQPTRDCSIEALFTKWLEQKKTSHKYTGCTTPWGYGPFLAHVNDRLTQPLGQCAGIDHVRQQTRPPVVGAQAADGVLQVVGQVGGGEGVVGRGRAGQTRLVSPFRGADRPAAASCGGRRPGTRGADPTSKNQPSNEPGL